MNGDKPSKFNTWQQVHYHDFILFVQEKNKLLLLLLLELKKIDFNLSPTILFIGFPQIARVRDSLLQRGDNGYHGIHFCTGPREWTRARACSVGQHLAVWACCFTMVVRVPAVGTKIGRLLGVEIWLKYKIADWSLKVGWSEHVITWVWLDN